MIMRWLRSNLLPLLLVAGPCQAVLEGRQVVSSVVSVSSLTSSLFVAPTGSPAPTINSSDYDLSQHFCRIYRHASTFSPWPLKTGISPLIYSGVYADGKIYIDGGNAYTPKGNTTFTATSASGWTKGMSKMSHT